jgi:hypothetical protein
MPGQRRALLAHVARNVSGGIHRTMLCRSDLNRRDLRSVLSRLSSGAREVHLERIDYHLSRRLTLSIGMASQVSPR